MPTTADRNLCPHTWTQSADVARSINQDGKTVTHTFAIYSCSLCGHVLERELAIND